MYHLLSWKQKKKYKIWEIFANLIFLSRKIIDYQAIN